MGFNNLPGTIQYVNFRIHPDKNSIRITFPSIKSLDTV